jgi:ABC-type transport system involved in multi-copper enzyme maturation permease subunit
MRTIWYSLVWKEWHEHKWKLASIMAILCALSAYILFAGRGEVDVLHLVYSIGTCCLLPLAIFVGLGDAAGERSRDTLSFLQSLPISSRRVAVTKLAFGLFTLIAAIALLILFVCVWCIVAGLFDLSYANSAARFATDGPRGLTNNRWISAILLTVYTVSSLYIWSASVGVNRKDEISAGAAAVIVMLGCWLSFAALVKLGLWHWKEVVAIYLGVLPGGAIAIADQIRRSEGILGLVFIVAILAHGALIARYVRRFGCVAERENYSPKGETLQNPTADKIATPFRSPLSAVVWKQLRESWVIALAGLAATVGIVVVMALGDSTEYLSRPKELGQLIASVSSTFGFVTAMVIGIGVCLYDVSPELNTFWRSRPIHRDLWFWSKALTGLAIAIFMVYAPALGALAATGTILDVVQREPQMFMLPAFHLAFFAAAMSMTCLARHAVYAAILSIPAALVGPALLYVGYLLAQPTGLWNYLRTEGWLEQQTTLALYIGSLLTSFVINILLAWLAMRFDWGRKSRY